MNQLRKSKRKEKRHASARSDANEATPSKTLMGIMITLFLAGFILLLCESRSLKFGGALSVSVCLFLGLIDNARRGELRTNWWTVKRSEHPIWFRIELGVWTVLAFLFSVTLVCHALGIIGTKVPQGMRGGSSSLSIDWMTS